MLRSAALIVLAAAGLTFAFTAGAQTVRGEIETIIKEYLAEHPDEVGAAVKDYLAKHPEVLQQAIIDMMQKRGAAPSAQAPQPNAAERAAAIKSNAELLFNSRRQVSLGASEPDVTLVEFFDYNCGFCKRALADTIALLKDDKRLRIVLKEFPILGPGSAEAARIGIALRMQDASGEKYLAFHQSLLAGRGPANRDSALAAAREAGADMARLETDVTSDEVDKTLAETRELARATGVNGTPAYIVGQSLIPGAIGITGLSAKIQEARQVALKN